MDELAEVEIDPETRTKVYNETRNVIIALFKKIKRQMSNDPEA